MPDAAIAIRLVQSKPDLAAFEALCREYAKSLEFSRECASLEHQGLEAELRGLPGKYAEPRGCMLLAMTSETPIGCVAIRPLEGSGAGGQSDVCEMKRMYVQPASRGQGAGRLLGEAVLAAARERGYSIMRLDTGAEMHAASGLYLSLGFREIERYNDDPVAGTKWMERRL